MSKALETQVWSNKDPKNNLLLGFELTGKESKNELRFLAQSGFSQKTKSKSNRKLWVYNVLRFILRQQQQIREC